MGEPGRGAIENKGTPLSSEACVQRQESGQGHHACHESRPTWPFPRFCTQRLPPEHPCIPAAASFPSGSPDSPCLLRLFFHRRTVLPTKLSRSSSPPSARAPTRIHTPPRQSFTPRFTPPARLRTSCYLPGANSPPSDRLHQEKKTSLLGARLGRSVWPGYRFHPKVLIGVQITINTSDYLPGQIRGL